MTPVERARGPEAVAASILAVTLIGVYFVASRGELGLPSPTYLLTAAVLLPAFWFPAVRLQSAADMMGRALSLALWMVAWTLVWDLATSGVVGRRGFLERWWLVYPIGLAVQTGLLLLQVTVARRDS